MLSSALLQQKNKTPLSMDIKQSSTGQYTELWEADKEATVQSRVCYLNEDFVIE